MNKILRQLAIKEIIQAQPIASQEELCLELKKRNFDVTQATLSRDLKELGVVRANTDQGLRYALSNEGEERKIKSLIGLEVTRIDMNEVMIIIRTLPGRAPGVASFIDSLHQPEILGTVAGDDTVLVLPSSVARTESIRDLIRSWMSERTAATN